MSEKPQVTVMLRDAGKLRATAEVTLSTPHGPITILDFKVIESDPGKAWISPPSREYQVRGQRKFQKIVEPSKPAMREISQAILEEYERLQKAA